MPPPSAILLLLYRRPALTDKLLRRLAQVRPPVLLVAADAPKTQADEAACELTRKLVREMVDWPCNVTTRYAEEHLGCKLAVSSAIDWAFTLHERLIILEDDCLPEPSFFRFCNEALERYADDERVMQICGSNLTGWRPADGAGAFFSRFGPVWGWASWRRAWANYDVEMKEWPNHRHQERLSVLCPQPFEARWRREILDAVHGGEIDTWDYQWAFAKMRRGGLNLFPNQHLVANIGFGADATHTHSADDPRGRLKTEPLPLPVRWPAEVGTAEEADRLYLQKVAGLPGNMLSWPGVRHWLKSWARQLRKRVRS
jgi:hypothetical protein